MLTETPTETRLFKLSTFFAREKKLPVFFVGRITRSTPKAIYIVGHGTTETVRMGCCCVCGRTLTHPVSVELGIGPECGSHWWDWDLIGGYTKENIARLRGEMVKVKVDCWIPRGCVKEALKTDEVVDVPTAQVETAKPVSTNGKPARRAEVVFHPAGPAGNVIHVFFPYNPDDQTDLINVRTLPARRFAAEMTPKRWICPVSVVAAKMLKSWGFALDATLKAMVPDEPVPPPTSTKPKTEKDIAGLNTDTDKPFPFQVEGWQYIEANNGRAIVGDEMGLGKTIQALMYLANHGELRPAIIVVPGSVKLNWKKEARKWLRKVSVNVLSGRKARPITDAQDLVVVNYDILPGWLDELKKLNAQVVICDEAHYLKNYKAQRSAAVDELLRGVPKVVMLSGTLTPSRPSEAYNPVRMVNPTLFPNFMTYARRYCDAKQIPVVIWKQGRKIRTQAWDFSGASHTDELNTILKKVMIRRLKKDVLTDLPDKLYSFTPMEMTASGEYNRALKEFKEWQESIGDEGTPAEALRRINYLKEICLKGKLPQVVEWVRNFIESDGKLVVFATHQETIDTLMEEFKDIAVKIDGTVPTGPRREAAVEAFQHDDKVRLFVGNIKAAGVGITLTAASNVAFAELPWNPGDLVQAEDRCHRIGQKNAVNIHYLLAEGTIEEEIAKLLDSKRGIVGAVLDGMDIPETGLLTELLESMKEAA